MRFKIPHVVVAAVLLMILCACSQSAAGTDNDGAFASADATEIGSVSNPDITYLLTFIAESGKPLEMFPALIKDADIKKDGYVLHIDRLEYNPDFEIGGLGEGGGYLLNECEKVEDVKTLDLACAEYDAKTAKIGPEFLDYVSASETGVEFIVFMAGGEAVYLCEITVP